MEKPDILESSPGPKISQRSFHGRKVFVWEGFTKASKIHGWVNNPRLEMELKSFRYNHAGREPSDEEVLAIMESVREFGLKELAEDIRNNGVRQPLILNTSGKLLDGNRRFYAVKHILEKTDPNDTNLSDYQRVPVWVLDESCSDEDEHRILVQENFYSSLKVEWPDFVKARFIYDDLTAGLPVQSVSQKYGWPPSKVRETRKVMDLINEFIQFATTPKDEDGLGMSALEAEKEAAQRYQQFNEAQKSFWDPLATDFEFKSQFFRWVADGKFSSFQEVRVAWTAWNDPNVRRILLTGGPDAGKRARAEIEYKKVVCQNTDKVSDRILNFVKFLEQLTSSEMASLPQESIDTLSSAMKTIVEMAKAAKGV